MTAAPSTLPSIPPQLTPMLKTLRLGQNTLPLPLDQAHLGAFQFDRPSVAKVAWSGSFTKGPAAPTPRSAGATT